jgi:protease-4
MESRHLKEDVMEKYADGRVFTGAQAVKLGFADEVGGYEDAVRATAKFANLGDNYEVFEIPKKRMSIFDFGENDHEDTLNSLAQYADVMKSASHDPIETITKKILKTQYLNQPMFLMPGYWE